MHWRFCRGKLTHGHLKRQGRSNKYIVIHRLRSRLKTKVLKTERSQEETVDHLKALHDKPHHKSCQEPAQNHSIKEFEGAIVIPSYPWKFKKEATLT